MEYFYRTPQTWARVADLQKTTPGIGCSGRAGVHTAQGPDSHCFVPGLPQGGEDEGSYRWELGLTVHDLPRVQFQVSQQRS